MNADEILLAAVEKKTPAERAAYLDGACGPNAALLARVEGLLKAHEQAGSFLEQPLFELMPTIDQPPHPEKPGTVIGPYKLLEQIGEGGFGVVFMAEQTQPVRRKVALKVLKPGMDTRQVVARFEAERQALAIMDHPNIAKVHDGGSTPTGRPYFVMELVKGVPITEFCDQNHLTPRQRLELFIPVCQAVQHAHHKGIIHRDLKPSNILVTVHDTTPVPKVIDFGVAKALGQELTEKTLFTGFAQMIGTPLYMSPEQAGQSGLDVDTRSDIYSLGVLLYELLTGSTPFSKERFKQAAYDEIRRIIREEEPPKPSARLSELSRSGEQLGRFSKPSHDTGPTSSLASVAAQRHTEPAKLTKLVRGELDWIVMKTLEKDRNRRYETANAFAADVQRYLNDEPVQACPPSAVYKFRKFARRHRARLAVAALLGLALLAVAGSIGWATRGRATRQFQLNKETTALLEDVERQRGEIHAKLADPIKVCELLSKIDGWHETLAKARAAWQNAKNLAATNHDVAPADLVKRLEDVDEELHHDEADWKIAKKLDDIRLEAPKLVDGKWDPSSAGLKYEQAFRDLDLDWHTSEPAQIAAKIQQARLRYVLVGTLDDWGAKSKNNRVQHLETARLVDPNPWRDQVREEKNWNNREALEKLAREVDFGIQSPQILAVLAGRLGQQKGDGVVLLRSALMYYPQDFWLHFNLGYSLQNPDQQIGCFQAALALRPTSSSAHNNIGNVLLDKKDLDGAIKHYHKALELDPNYALIHNNIGHVLLAKKDLDGAIKHLHKALELDPNYSSAYNGLGQVMHAKNDLDGAIKHLHKALELDPNDARHHNNLGNVLRDKKDVDGAIRHYSKALELDSMNSRICHNLGTALRDKKDLDGAIQHFRKALELDPNNVKVHFTLGHALDEKKDFDGAVKHFRKVLELDPNYVKAHINLGIALIDKKDLYGAIHHLRKALDLEPKDWKNHQNLGNALSENKDFEGAIKHYHNALELDPNLPTVHLGLGNALSKKKDLDGAIHYYLKALELDPKYSQAHYGLGNALYEKKDLDGAIQHYRKAIDLDPNYALAHNNLGNALRDKKDLDGAIKHYRKALELDPYNVPAHTNLGGALRDKKDLDGAIKHYRKALELDPNNALAHQNLGAALMDKKDLDGAIRHYRKALELDAKYSQAHYGLGNALRDKKDFDSAIQHYRKALDLDPNYAEANCNLGNCLGRNGQFAEALKYLRRGHELGSKRPDWAYPSAKWVQEGERVVKFDQQVPAVLKGDVQPASPQEWLGYVEVCRLKKTYATALQLWNQFMLKHSAVADNPKSGFRANAARDAVLASGSQDKDAGNITDADRSAMRKQAYEWLHADLEAWSKHVAKKQPDAVLALADVLPQWQKSPELAGVRDEQHLAKLPEEERKSWHTLWTDVEQLGKQAHGMFKETTRLSGMVTLKQREPVHEVKLQAGTTYVIDLESNAFDTFLRLEDAQAKMLAENDDIEDGINIDSRLTFTPKTDGMYRLTASAFQQSGAGQYTLTIREFVK